MEVGGKIIVAVVHQILATRLIIVITPFSLQERERVFSSSIIKKEIVFGKLISPPTIPLCFSKTRNLGPEKRGKERSPPFHPEETEAGRKNNMAVI